VATTRSPQHAQRQPYLRDVRLDRRQFDALVDVLRRLQGLRECRLAVRTSGQPGINHAIRVRVQRATHAGPALAGRASIAGRRAIFLLALRRRRRRVVGRLRRAGEFIHPCPQYRDLLLRRFKLRDQRQD